ncbi:MAG: antibiotic biosynthesis monooxygenase [Thermoleophilia bacterium]
MQPEAIHWVAVLTLHDGQRREWEAQAQRTIDTARDNEPGQLVYEWHLSSDGTTCHVDEWYADTAAAVAHVRGRAVTEELPKLLQFCDFTALWVQSPVDDPELRALLEGFGAQFWSPWGGHRRHA